MFTLNDDLSIYATRGDTVFFTVTAEENGIPYYFEAGDVLRMKIFQKKNATNLVMEKCFPVTAKTDRFTILLTEEDTKFGDVISKATDYWYEIELNPFTNPQTIIGYDEDGAKVFRLFPEGKDSEVPEVDPEDIPVVDDVLDMTSPRPVQNQAIARAIVNLAGAVNLANAEVKEEANKFNKTAASVTTKLAVERARIDNLLSGAAADDAELVDVRVGADGVTYDSAGTAVREQLKAKMDAVDCISPKSATKNLLLLEHYKTGSYYDSNSGELVSGENSGHYPTVKVEPDALYTNCRCQILCIYDEDMNFIESDTKYAAIKTFKTPENAAYVTVGGSLENYGSEGLYFGEYTGEYVAGEKLFTIEQVDGLKKELDRVLTKSVGKNLFNKNSETLVMGMYINAVTGELGSHTAYCYDVVEALPGETYTVSTNQNVHIAFFDASGAYISGTSSSNSVTFVAPNNAVTMSVSVRQEHLEKFQLEKGNVQTPYADYQEGLNGSEIVDHSIGYEKLSKDVQNELGKRAIHVGDGYEYQSVLKALKAHDGEGVTCYVHTGVYDLVAEYVEEYGVDYFDNYSGYAGSDDLFDRGLNLSNGTSLVGVGIVEIDFYYTGNNEAVKKYFAPINTTQNNTVENITLAIGESCCRYGIHDDFADDEGTNVFRNCYFYGASYLNTFMGCGFGMKNTYIIENCVFENAGGLNIAYHNNEKAGAKNKLLIKDCYCNGRIRGGMYGASTEASLMVVTNCKASGISCVLTDETGTYTNKNIKLCEWNNVT